jgi:hypothetical protein
MLRVVAELAAEERRDDRDVDESDVEPLRSKRRSWLAVGEQYRGAMTKLRQRIVSNTVLVRLLGVCSK